MGGPCYKPSNLYKVMEYEYIICVCDFKLHKDLWNSHTHKWEEAGESHVKIQGSINPADSTHKGSFM